MKGLNEVWAVSEMCSRFPTVMSSIIALPFDEVLVLVTILTTVKDAFDFVLEGIINLYRGRRRRVWSIDVIAIPRWEAVDMEDRMLVHSWREAETIGEFTSALEDFIWAELPRGKFSTGMGGENVFGAKPDLLARRECVGWWFVGFKGLFHSAFLHPQSGFGVLTSVAQFTQPRVQGRELGGWANGDGEVGAIAVHDFKWCHLMCRMEATVKDKFGSGNVSDPIIMTRVSEKT
jgi:hypothetical protein